MTDGQRNLDEKDRVRRIFEDHMKMVNNKQKDELGISGAMIDAMLQTVAEGLATGSTDMRSLLYCAYRNAQKIQNNT